MKKKYICPSIMIEEIEATTQLLFQSKFSAQTQGGATDGNQGTTPGTENQETPDGEYGGAKNGGILGNTLKIFDEF